MGSTVAIIGRPNVGKSTIFNRLIEQRKAIIDDMSGVTRDRIYGESEWGGKVFNIIDTGGFVPNSVDVFESAIREQVLIAMEEASLILFMVDVTTGITDLDDAVATLLRKNKKDVILVVNKVDNTQRLYDGSEFYSLGFENIFFISSISGAGTGDLLDAIALKVDGKEEENLEGIPKVAIIGQPNVGKSSMINALLGEERNIVTNVAGTTRDTINSRYNKFDKEFILIDTAGIRRKNKVSENLEFYTVIRAIKAMDEADIIILMVDARTGLEGQDMSLYKLAEKKRKGIILVVNKWDLVTKETNTMKGFEEQLRTKLAPFNDIPIIFTSVHEKQRIYNVIENIFTVYENLHKKIKTSVLNDFLKKITDKHAPPSHRGSFVTIKYVTQLPAFVPTFAFFSNYPKQIGESYRHYIENQMREEFDFKGVPINVFFREK
ncbi:MAG: ribosome biogenesis GTPase Der [Chitinophagales bacterium]|nr:ribosome biogenesis GTPase Der [Chitinophagales bacterium]